MDMGDSSSSSSSSSYARSALGDDDSNFTSQGKDFVAIDSSNRGFQLLKKHGWREGTGLGISGQGRLEPVQAHLKNNKRGLGADKKKKKTLIPLDTAASSPKCEKEILCSKKLMTMSKRLKKMEKLEMRLQEKEFERAFCREFWPDNGIATCKTLAYQNVSKSS